MFKILDKYVTTYSADDAIEIDSSKLVKAIHREHEQDIIRPTNYLNGSIIEYKGKLVFAYRTEQKPFFTNSTIHICELDDEFQPKTESVLLRLPVNVQFWNVTHESNCYQMSPLRIPYGFRCEDPRLFEHNSELHMAYCDGYKMFYTKLNDDYTFEDPLQLPVFQLGRREKNWSPFSCDGKLYFIYQTAENEQVVLQIERDEIVEVHTSLFTLPTKFGSIRGGTPAYRTPDGNSFITFFHTHRKDSLGGEECHIYGCGAYVFEAKPPFQIKWVCDELLFKGEVYPNAIERPGLYNSVAFPAGAIYDAVTKFWYVSFGYQDTENRVMPISDDVLQYV
jgi:predicted GH43/DUF377 family glycosyl hydrolase